MATDDLVLLGHIARPHGIRGQVIVNPETDFPEDRFQPGAELFIERRGAVEALRVTTARFHRERPVIGIEGIETVDDAATLSGHDLRVPVARLAALPPDTFYRHDLDADITDEWNQHFTVRCVDDQPAAVHGALDR